MKSFLKSDAFLKTTFLGDAALIGVGFLLAYVPLRSIAEPLVIHFTSIGIDRIGTTWDLLRIALLGWMIVGLNFAITRELLARDLFLSRIVSGTTALLSILIFYVFYSILRVN